MRKLSVYRGDTKVIRFTLTDKVGNSYTASDDDNLIFTVKKSFSNNQALILKAFPTSIICEGNEYQILIASADTTALAYGRYVFDIFFEQTNANARRTIAKGFFYVNPKCTFILNEEEVTNGRY